MTVRVRTGGAGDIAAALAVYRSANTARRGGVPVPAAYDERVAGHLGRPDALLLIAADRSDVVGMAVGLQALENDGAGEPVPGLCHISSVFVDPHHWGRGIGKKLMTAMLAAAIDNGYAAAQLWTHADNVRAQQLYEGLGFARTGREKDDDLGERIVHYRLSVLRAPTTSSQCENAAM